MKRWVIAAGIAAALVAGVTGLAASGPPTTGSLGTFFLGPKMARAEVVMVYGGQVHDWRIDQGTVAKVGPAAMTVVERDGTRAVIPVSIDATVTLNRRLAVMSDLTRGMKVLAARDGNAPATIVKATTTGASIR
ncbi:MAG: hypothetical protein C5B48_14575 [Candidatus Rokuibacteriota bacterium]|nr:MAG: hypothetical protein C5B48_14575 [Candidatus Rokubacteria bacterium]